MKARKSKKRKPKAKPVKMTVQRGHMSEEEAARACASLFLREGIPEGREVGEFEIEDVDLDDDGYYYATVKVRVGWLDVEAASTGDHIDQAKIDEIKAEQEAS